MITFTGAFHAAQLTRGEAIALHRDNVAAIRRRIALIRSAAPAPGDPGTLRVIASLEADIAGQLELIELARAHDYPYPLAGTGPAQASPGGPAVTASWPVPLAAAAGPARSAADGHRKGLGRRSRSRPAGGR